MTTYTIGQLAKAAGVSVESVRYYERRGLIIQPPRINGAYRRYPVNAADRIRFIKKNQSLGFTLREIGEVLALMDGDRADLNYATVVLDQKIVQIEEKMVGFKETLATLRLLKKNIVDRAGEGNAFSIPDCLLAPMPAGEDPET